MARRSRSLLWGSALQKSLQKSLRKSFGALTRATLRAGTRAAVNATAKAIKAATQVPAKKRKPAPSAVRRSPAARAAAAAAAGAAAAPGAGRWINGLAIGPTGARRYRLYLPIYMPPTESGSPRPATRAALASAPGAAAGRPVLVLLHGCDQDATGFAESTRLQALAAREGFLLLCPEQDRLANPHGCWNWFETRSGRAFTEAASIVAAIDQVCAVHGGDASRVAVAGLSAGAAMAALLGLWHPARFKAVVMHSGVGPGAAHSTASALAAMRGRRAPTPIVVPAGQALPAMLVIQGLADAIVDARNGRAAARAWAAACGASARAPRTVQRGERHAATLTDFTIGARSFVTLCEVSRLDHAWSGGRSSLPYGDPKGPDASRMVWAFAQRQFKAARVAGG